MKRIRKINEKYLRYIREDLIQENQTLEAGYNDDQANGKLPTQVFRHSKYKSQADEMMLKLKVTDKEIESLLGQWFDDYLEEFFLLK